MLLAAGGVVWLLRHGPAGHQAVEQMEIDARCTIVAGQHLASQTIRISCGLDKAEVQAAVARAVVGMDLADLVAKARAGRAQDEVRVGQIAQQLGMSVDDIVHALAQIGAESADGAGLGQMFAEALVRDPRLDIESASLASRPAIRRKRTQREANRTTPFRRWCARRGDCAALAGGHLDSDVVDVHCGPSESEIRKLIDDTVSQADLAKLIQLAGQRGDGSAPTDQSDRGEAWPY